jgi:tetratricopeptide (TPR) repeat protein
VPDLDEALALVDRVSASNVVLGSVTSAAGRLVVSVRLYDAGGALRNSFRSAVSTDSLGAAVNRLALDLVSEVWERDSLPSVPVVEALATENIDALKAYLDAKSLSHRGRFSEAEAAVERAVSLDSTFALAYLEQFSIRSSVLFQNAQPFTGLRELIERAMDYRHRLSERNRLRVEANRALDDTDGLGAATLFGRILEMDPLDFDALSGLAYTYLLHGWQLDKGITDVTAAYERIAIADSTEASTFATLARIAAWEGDDDRLDQIVPRLAGGDTTSAYVTGTLGAIRTLRATGPFQDSILRTLANQPIPVVTTVLRDLRSTQPDVAERFLDELMVDSMPVMHQRVGMGARTQLWFGEGRVTANDSLVRTGWLDRIRPSVNGYFVATLLAGVGDSSATARAVSELEFYAPVDSLEELLDSRWVWGTGWAVASYYATVGDTAEARVWQRALAALPQGDTPWDWTASLTADIEARLAVRRGDLATAEREARRAFDLWTVHSHNVLETHPEPAMRFHLAEILQTLRRTDEAASLYRSFVPPYNWAGFYTARSALELGSIAEASGDLTEAALRYSQAAALWRRGGAEVTTWRRRAEDGLQRVLTRIG